MAEGTCSVDGCDKPVRRYRVRGSGSALSVIDATTAAVPLARGGPARVDIEMGDKVAPHLWSLTNNGYAYTTIDGVQTLLHRFVLGLTQGDPDVDHVNRDKLDCRRSNLRMASASQNAANTGKRRFKTGTSSSYKGVSFFTRTGRWHARITVGRRQMHLGYFATEEEAADAYDDAAVRYHGSFACTNRADQ